MRRATGRPSTAGTARTIMVIKANCATTPTVANSARSQTKPVASNTGKTQRQGLGRKSASSLRIRQISQSEIGGTRKA